MKKIVTKQVRGSAATANRLVHKRSTLEAFELFVAAQQRFSALLKTYSIRICSHSMLNTIVDLSKYTTFADA